MGQTLEEVSLSELGEREVRVGTTRRVVLEEVKDASRNGHRRGRAARTVNIGIILWRRRRGALLGHGGLWSNVRAN
jgi:hypothetical protein